MSKHPGMALTVRQIRSIDNGNHPASG